MEIPHGMFCISQKCTGWGVSKDLLVHVFGYQIGICSLLLSSRKVLLIFRLLFLVNKMTGTYIVGLCLPFTSFVSHFIHHPRVLLEINQSIVTTWTTMLMQVEACRVHLTAECDWLPLSWEDDSPGFRQRSLTSSDILCQNRNLVSEEDTALVTVN